MMLIYQQVNGRLRMPTISVFYGILIQMFWRDHAPPHFHALYAEDEALIDISTLEMIQGSLPKGAGSLLEWTSEHRASIQGCGRLSADHGLALIRPTSCQPVMNKIFSQRQDRRSASDRGQKSALWSRCAALRHNLLTSLRNTSSD